MRLQTVVIGFLCSKKSIHILYFFVPFPSFLTQYVYGRERDSYILYFLTYYIVSVYFSSFFNPVSSFKSIKINNPKTCAADRFRESRKKGEREKTRTDAPRYHSPQSFWPFVPFPTISVIIANNRLFCAWILINEPAHNKIYYFITHWDAFKWRVALPFDIIEYYTLLSINSMYFIGDFIKLLIFKFLKLIRYKLK